MAFDNNVPLAANQIAADLAAINANWELVVPLSGNLGTPSAGNLTNCAGLPAAGVVGTALVVSGALGTPSAGVLTNCTGLPLTGLVATAWTTPAFAVGDFTASGAMTWTVEAGDVIAYAYTIIGKTMTVAFHVVTTTVGGTLDSDLRITIPAGKISTKSIVVVIAYNDNGTLGIGYCFTSAGGTTINMRKVDNANWLASTNITQVKGQIVLEIN